MNVPPTCDGSHPDGPHDAVFVVIDKTNGQSSHACREHLVYLNPKHTYSIFPAKDYSKHAEDPEEWLSIEAAKKIHICRVCREKADPKQRPDGTMNSFWLGHGYEHAHEDCLTTEALERMRQKIAETGPHRGD